MNEPIEDLSPVPPFEGLPFHPLANCWPLMEGAEFEAMVLDIKTHGLRQDIILWEGQIFDGRNRYRACQRAKVVPRFCHWDGSGDPLTFLQSLNQHRRHETPSQRALTAAKIAQAREDMSAAAAAAACHVPVRTVERATRVLNNADPEVIEAVATGEVTLNDAEQVAEQPRSKQKEAVKKVKNKVAPTMQAAVAAGVVITDQLGLPVHGAASQPFSLTERWSEARSLVGKLAVVLNELASFTPGSDILRSHLHLKVSAGKEGWLCNELKKLVSILEDSQPYASACPHCQGKTTATPCNGCKGRGWVNKAVWTKGPEETRLALTAQLEARTHGKTA